MITISNIINEFIGQSVSLGVVRASVGPQREVAAGKTILITIINIMIVLIMITMIMILIAVVVLLLIVTTTTTTNNNNNENENNDNDNNNGEVAAGKTIFILEKIERHGYCGVADESLSLSIYIYIERERERELYIAQQRQPRACKERRVRTTSTPASVFP